MTPAADGSCFELHVGSGDDSTFTIVTDGITGLAVYAQHIPIEFERDRHYLYDSSDVDIEPIAQESAGGDHGHSHDHDHDDDTCHLTADSNEDGVVNVLDLLDVLSAFGCT